MLATGDARPDWPKRARRRKARHHRNLASQIAAAAGRETDNSSVRSSEADSCSIAFNPHIYSFSVPSAMPMMRGDAAPPSHAAAKLRSALHRSRSESRRDPIRGPLARTRGARSAPRVGGDAADGGAPELCDATARAPDLRGAQPRLDARRPRLARLARPRFGRPRRRRRLGLLGAGAPRGAQPAAAGARRPHALRVRAGAAEEVRRDEEGGARRGELRRAGGGKSR